MSFGSPGEKHGIGGLFGKESNTNYDVYLNLTPLMDVMSNILFFLLAAFGSTIVAVLPTTVPLRSSDSAAAPDTEEKVTVTLRVDGQGFSVACDSPNIAPDLLREYSVKLPKKGGSYDNAGLTVALKRIKQRYPLSKTMILVPDDDLLYEVIVEIMDAARDYPLADGRRITLFDEVVMSSIPASEKRK